jgi:hypothetical protein
MPQNQITDINRSKTENALQKLLKEYELTRVGAIKYKKELYTVYDKPNSKITVWYSPKVIAIEMRASYRFKLEEFTRKLKKELKTKGINMESLREEKEVIPLSNYNI